MNNIIQLYPKHCVGDILQIDLDGELVEAALIMRRANRLRVLARHTRYDISPRDVINNITRGMGE